MSTYFIYPSWPPSLAYTVTFTLTDKKSLTITGILIMYQAIDRCSTYIVSDEFFHPGNSNSQSASSGLIHK